MKKSLLLAVALTTGSALFAEPVKLTNVVCFVNFSDQPSQWYHGEDNADSPSYDWYESFFNSREESVNSVRNYFNTMSYGRADWESQIIKVEYTDAHPRSYYLAKSESNPEGYDEYTLLLNTRIKLLVQDICSEIDALLPDDINLDGNNDGEVDNLTIVFNGSSDISSSRMLWPQNFRINNGWASDLKILLKNKRIGNVLQVFDHYNGYKSLDGIELNTGVVCHEMMHTLDAYDLYTSKNSPQIDPVNVWDLMSDNQKVPQSVTAYIRNRYSKNFGEWIRDDEIKELTEEGVYELNPLNSPSPENVVYKIYPDKDKKEYFMIEYRDRADIWDKTLPPGGIIVYRVNPTVKGNLGAKQEVYIFRPGGSQSKPGKIRQAALGSETNRFSFGTEDDEDYPFYSDGTRAGFSISEVTPKDGAISFKFSMNNSSAIDEIERDNGLTGLDRAELDAKIRSGEVTVYNLQGQRLRALPSSPGVYILNGKKIYL